MPDGYSRSPVETWRDTVVPRWHRSITITSAMSPGDSGKYLRAEIAESGILGGKMRSRAKPGQFVMPF